MRNGKNFPINKTCSFCAALLPYALPYRPAESALFHAYVQLSCFFPESFWETGMRVAVPLGGGAVRIGVILALHTEKDGDFQIRELAFPMEGKSLLSADYILMIEQLAKKQFVSTGRILGNVLPSNLKTTKNIRLRVFQDTQKPKIHKIREIPKLSQEEKQSLANAFLENKAQILEMAEDTSLTERICLLAEPPWNIRANANKQREILDFLADNGSMVRNAFQKNFRITVKR